MNPITADELRPDIRAFLEGWFAKSRARQEANGRSFEITFGDYLQLWGRRRIRSLGKWMDDGSLFVRQRRATKDDPNPNGYVLSPNSFAASREGVCRPDNMMIATRGEALVACRMKKGDTHTDASRQAISRGTRGVRKSPEHRRAISRAMRGMKRGSMSQGEKDKRSATVRATLARKRAEKAAGVA